MCTEPPRTAAELQGKLDDVRTRQVSLVLKATSYGIHLLSDGLGGIAAPDSISRDVERISGRLRDIVIELDGLAGRISK